MSGLVIRRGQLGGKPVDVRLEHGRIAEVAPRVQAAAGDQELDAAGGHLVPGLHDHHIHLLALAAEESSVRVGPAEVRGLDGLASALRAAAASPVRSDGWVRAVGYHESVAGELDRHVIDRCVDDRPVRVQHRSGVLWVLNSAGLAAVGAGGEPSAGVERDAGGEPTGRLWRMDRWLAARAGRGADPDPDPLAGLRRLSRAAAARGVTGWTDATPGRDESDNAMLSEAVHSGAVMQRLHLMLAPGSSGSGVVDAPTPLVTAGPVKVMLDDFDLPDLDSLARLVRESHAAGHAVAFHCVTRTQLVLAVTALGAGGGAVRADRIEHGAIVPTDLIPRLAQLGLTVVTQPNFVAERGDEYLGSVDPADLPDLWRIRSLLSGGVRVAAGTDAPFGRPDPWAALRAATTRAAPSGRQVGPGERVGALEAAAMWWGTPADPASPRGIVPGQPADVAVLDAPLQEVVNGGVEAPVRATVIAGDVVYG